MTKKQLIKIFICVFVICWVIAGAFFFLYDSGIFGCTFVVYDDGTLDYVKGKTRGHFAFPTEVEGNTITTLGVKCLDNQKHITKITVPDGIVIMCWSIRECNYVTELYFGKDLEDIYAPLIPSPKLERIIVDEKNPYYYVDNGCLIDRRNNWMYLATNGAVIPDYVELIAAYAFSGHILTEDLIIPDGVKEIDEYAMCGLTGKANVYIPKDTYVWWSAFYGSSKDVTFCFEAEQNSTGEWMAEQGYSVRFGVEIPQQ